MTSLAGDSKRLTSTQWLIVSLASIGFAFDIYELLMMQFVIKDLIVELTDYKPGSDGFRYWGSMLFYVPALAGGVFGLLGGYLTDRLGRRRVLTWSILIYAFSAFASGLFHVDPDATHLAVRDVRRRVRRVRGGRGLAGRAVSRSPAARKRAGVYPGVFVAWAGSWWLVAYWLAAHYAGVLAHDRVARVSWPPPWVRFKTAMRPGGIR